MSANPISAPSNGGDIIIKGGSVQLQFDDQIFPGEHGNPGHHENLNRRITRVVITGDVNFDSGDHPQGLKCTITASSK
jgi:hypothetical protein